jgi:hypothetical protein
MVYAFALILLAGIIAVGLYNKLRDHAGEPPGVAPPILPKKPKDGDGEHVPGQPQK